MEAVTKQVKVVIRGQVQGVGFRHTTTQTARHIGCTGWVRNNPDRTVTCVAQGTDAQLQQLIEFLHEGPRSARVADVDVTWETPTQAFDAFQIRS